MTWTAREVLIPLVAGPEAQTGALGRVLADADLPPPHPARLDPVISELLEHGLYQAGQQALAGLRRYRQRSRGWFRGRSGALSVANPGDLLGLAPANANSAELGLALALALFRAQARTAVVLATGALDSGESDPRVPVRPIHHLGAKLAHIERHFRQAGGSAPPKLCLVPTTDPDGVPVTERHSAAIQALAELGIGVRPVATLAEALECIGARDRAPHPAERTLRWSAGLVVGAAVGLLAAVLYLDRPLPLAFAPASLADGRVALTPLRAHWSTQTGLSPLPNCSPGTGGLPVYRSGDVVALRLVWPDSGIGADRWLGYFGVVVGVGAISGVKVLPLQPDRTDSPLMPGTVHGVLVPVVDPEEDNLLAILVRRARPFDREQLQRQLGGHLDGLRPSEQISAASNWLERQAPGVLTYRFRNTAQEASCP